MDAASNNGVDDIRDLRDEVAYLPSVCRYKVYIIDEVHMLSTQAFNALLKTMEEPPEHVIFILATTEVQKVPVTILSRCQRYDFARITAQEIAGLLPYGRRYRPLLSFLNDLCHRRQGLRFIACQDCRTAPAKCGYAPPVHGAGRALSKFDALRFAGRH